MSHTAEATLDVFEKKLFGGLVIKSVEPYKIFIFNYGFNFTN